MTIEGNFKIKNILIDGLGIGDVGNVVLRDRLMMSADGIVMVVIPVERASGNITGEIDIVSRGFVYMKESDKLINEAKQVIIDSLTGGQVNMSDFRFVRRRITDSLEKFLFQATHRRPLIQPVIVEV